MQEECQNNIKRQRSMNNTNSVKLIRRNWRNFIDIFISFKYEIKQDVIKNIEMIVKQEIKLNNFLKKNLRMLKKFIAFCEKGLRFCIVFYPVIDEEPGDQELQTNRKKITMEVLQPLCGGVLSVEYKESHYSFSKHFKSFDRGTYYVTDAQVEMIPLYSAELKTGDVLTMTFTFNEEVVEMALFINNIKHGKLSKRADNYFGKKNCFIVGFTQNNKYNTFQIFK